MIGEVDDAYIKVAKIHGSLTWYSHENEDELFLVLKGNLRIELEDSVVELSEGDMYIVPKGVRHNPVADEACQIMRYRTQVNIAYRGDRYRENSLLGRTVAASMIALSG